MFWLKLAGIAGVAGVIFAGYQFVTGYIEAAEQAKQALVAREIEVAEKQTHIDMLEQVREAERRFQDQKSALQSRLNAAMSAARIAEIEAANKIEASKLERVSRLENEFSTAAERLTRRAKIATEKLASEIEQASRLDEVYD